MKLIAIKPANFRAFGSCDWITLDADLVTCFGPNGSGKSSLAEAVEWLFYGETRRRQRGDGYSKLEYRGSYANAHAKGPVGVSARVRLPDGSVRAIGRRLVVGPRGAETSQTYVDGRPGDWRSLGIVADEVHYPVITQHGLQDLIHVGPKERRDAICAMLGLEALASFKTSLDRARIAFHKTAPSDVAEARDALALLRKKLLWNDDTARLAERWDEDLKGVSLSTDWRVLTAAAQTALGARDADPGRLIAGLERKREEVQARVFDLRPIRPPADLAQRAEAAHAQARLLPPLLRELREAAGRFPSQSSGENLPEMLAFWETGLRLSASEPSCRCPLCGEPTLLETRRQTLRERIDQNRGHLEARRHLAASAEAVRSATAALRQLVEGIVPPEIDGETRRKLAAAMSGLEVEALAYLATCDETRGKWSFVASALSEQEQWAATLATGRVGLPPNRAAPEAATAPRAPGHLVASPQTPDLADHLPSRERRDGGGAALVSSSLIGESIAAVEGCAERFAALEHALGERLSSSEDVRKIDALIAGLKTRRQLETIGAYNAFREEMAETSRVLEAFIQEKQRSLLVGRSEQIRSFYDLMNPGAAVRFLEMEPALGSTRLFAESFGERLSAPACLSTSQLNCLGLSIQLLGATSPDSPFGFIVLDDPFQSMDAGRCESFIANVIPHLIDRYHKQVIILTHASDLASRMADLSTHRRPLRYHLDRCDAKWPAVLPAGRT